MARAPWTALIPLGVLGVVLTFLATLALRDEIEPERLAFPVAFALPLFALGVYAYRRRPDQPIARLLLLTGALTPLGAGGLALAQGLFDQGSGRTFVFVVGFVALVVQALWTAAAGTLLGLLPDGRVRRPYEHWLLGGIWIGALAPVPLLLVSDARLDLSEARDPLVVSNPASIDALSSLAPIGSAIAGSGHWILIGLAMLALRYRRGAREDRLKIRWLLVVPLAGVIAFTLVAVSGANPGANLTLAVEMLFLFLIPVALGVAIFKHRLLDVDVLLRRSLVYGALWLAIAAAYVGVAAALGIAAGERVPVAVAVLATIAATLLFQPARRRLERLADRFVFGERLSGYELLARFGATLEETFDPAELLSRIAETVRRGLRVRWARVSLRIGDGPAARLEPVAASGVDLNAGDQPELSVAVAHAGDPLGAIDCGLKEDGRPFAEEDRELLANLARQAALAIHNVRLATELAGRLDQIRLQANELAASRARIVQAEEAGRRRIERNIHDGVQQELVALIAKLRLARNHLARDSALTASTLAELQEEAAVVLDDLRELAQGIHPSVLSDRGLVEAIEARSARMPIEVRIEADESVRGLRYREDIEGAAYFIVSEGLANVLKHAAARRAVVRLGGDGGRLRIEVSDDGAGFDAGEIEQRGLAHLNDRVEALGGRLRVTSHVGRGTTLACELPARALEDVRV